VAAHLERGRLRRHRGRALERLLQRLGELHRGLVAVLGLLLHPAEDDLHQRGGEVGVEVARVGRRIAHVHPHHRERLAGLEGEAPGEDVVEHHRRRVEVAARVGPEAASLLRGHEVGGAADVAVEGDPGGGVAADLREPEVHHLHEVVAGAERLDQDVLGLDVAVDDLRRVRLGERGEHLADDLDGARRRQRSRLPHQPREVDAPQELHHDEQQPVLGAPEVEHAHRVGVVEPGAGAGLGVEARHRGLVAREVRMDHLHREGLAEGGLLGAVHAAHAARSDGFEDDVPGAELATDERIARPVAERADGEAARGAVFRFFGAAGGALLTGQHDLGA
jgi:hypothetical protein